MALWSLISATWAKELPSPLKTWETSKTYILQPLAKRGEMDQGILRMASYSLLRVAKGYLLALLIGTPLGFLLGTSRLLSKILPKAIKEFA
jgi:nitrate/nitrite transport system permease protein